MLLSEKHSYNNKIFMKVSSIDEFHVDDLSVELFEERYFKAGWETRKKELMSIQIYDNFDHLL